MKTIWTSDYATGETIGGEDTMEKMSTKYEKRNPVAHYWEPISLRELRRGEVVPDLGINGYGLLVQRSGNVLCRIRW